MKRLAYILLVLIATTGCQSEREKNIDNITKAIRQDYEDNAFKRNEKIDLLTINGVTYSMIGESTLDTLRRGFVNERLDTYLSLSDDYQKIVDSAKEGMRLSRELNEHIKFTNEASDANNRKRVCLDSAKYYFGLDTTIRLRIENRKADPQIYYAAKYFCKSTIGGHNVMDTLFKVLDKNYNVIDATKSL